MRTKRKSHSHIIEEKSLSIIKNILPNYWTVRDYKPDYGIDLVAELFESKTENNRKVYDTLGEHIFIQVKGTENIDFVKYPIYERQNIEKGDPKNAKLYKEIDAVKFVIETPELYTVERMSNAVPVLLFVVDVNNDCIYYICLNDYIDKVLVPYDPQYYEKGTKTIFIPKENVIKCEDDINPLLLYSKRAKLYAFFNKVNYQSSEFEYLDNERMLNLYPHFINILLRFDVWGIGNEWHIMEIYRKKLLLFKEMGCTRDSYFANIPENIRNIEGWEMDGSDVVYSLEQVAVFWQVRNLWKDLDNLRNVFEEVCREWFLPTYVGLLCSE